MKTKKVLSVILAAGLSVGALSMEASAALYQRHQSNDATFETLKEAHENAPGFIMSEYPARTYVGDPALDAYPENTTYVYRSAGMLNTTAGGPRMHTNLMVYTDQSFADKDAALAYITELGLTKMVDEATGSVVLVTPINPETGFGDADQYAYYQLQSAMCNVGFSIRGEDSSTYYADAGYFGGVTNRYVIGIDGGATFINNYISPTMDYVGRIAGMLLIGGEMEKIQEVPVCVPVWLVNADEDVVQKYAAGNETDSVGRNGDDLLYYNSDHPLQQVISTTTDEVDVAACVQKAYDELFIKSMRVPVVQAGL